MTHPQHQRSDGASPLYTSTGTGLTYRRTSYASVAAGTASTQQASQSAAQRPGAFSHLMHLTSPPVSYTQQSNPNQSSRMSNPIPAHPFGTGGIDVPESWGRAGGALSHPDQHYYGYGRTWPDISLSEPLEFFTPTYLRGSKYMERLEKAYKPKSNAQRDGSNCSPRPGSLSASSSSVSLHKLTPSHRGMTYEIIERHPPPEEDSVSPLPSKWGEVDKHGGLELASDGLDVKYVGLTKMHDHEAVAARADQPMPPECGLYYFEVTIISKGKEG